MKITIVCRRPCIRVTKEAFALYEAGHEVNLVSPILDSDYPYKHALYWEKSRLDQLRDAVKLIEPETDIFVVHNEPTWPLTVLRETLPDARIVLDYHDSIYWYFDTDAEVCAPNEKARFWEEDVAVQLADGFVVPSEGCRDELLQRTDKPIIDIPPAFLEKDARYAQVAYSGGLVCQGGHAVPGQQGRLGTYWRDYTKLYAYLLGRCNTYVYTPDLHKGKNAPVNKHYPRIVTSIDVLPYNQMLDRLGAHSWNLVGNWCEHRVWQFSAPNKFYDALAAGLPSVVFHIKSVIDIMEEEGFGISITHPDELLDRWDECLAMRTQVFLKRHKYTMNRFIGRAVDLYKEVLR